MLRLLAQRGSWAALQAAAGPALPRALQLASRLTASWAGPFGDSSPQRNQPENQTQSEKAAVSHFVSEVRSAQDGAGSGLQVFPVPALPQQQRASAQPRACGGTIGAPAARHASAVPL
jgi:hypothetical protein